MKEALASAFKLVFDKLGQFFDILDLSFFVAGAIALGALSLWAQLLAVPTPAWLAGGGLIVPLAAIVASYVLGVMCFAFGRTARRQLEWSSGVPHVQSDLQAQIEGHAIGDELDLAGYLERAGAYAGLRWLYAKLWAELRETDSLKSSYDLIRRYWTLAALCDAASAALGVWVVVILYWTFGYAPAPPPVLQQAPAAAPAAEKNTKQSPSQEEQSEGEAPPQAKTDPQPAKLGQISGWATLLLVPMLALAIGVCLREARRYQEYQVEEIISTFAYHVPLRDAKKTLDDAREKLDKDLLAFETQKLDVVKREQELAKQEQTQGVENERLKLKDERQQFEDEKLKWREEQLKKQADELERLRQQPPAQPAAEQKKKGG